MVFPVEVQDEPLRLQETMPPDDDVTGAETPHEQRPAWHGSAYRLGVDRARPGPRACLSVQRETILLPAISST